MSRLAPARPSMATCTRPSGSRNHTPTAATPTAIEVSGPTTAIQNSWRGLLAAPSISVMPPRKCKVMELTLKPNRWATIACDASCSSTER